MVEPRVVLVTGAARSIGQDISPPRVNASCLSISCPKSARPPLRWAARGSVVNTLTETFEDPQVRHRGVAVPMPHPLTPDRLGTVSPIRLQSTPPSVRRPPPMRGQHTDETLAKLGLSVDELDALRAAAVI